MKEEKLVETQKKTGKKRTVRANEKPAESKEPNKEPEEEITPPEFCSVCGEYIERIDIHPITGKQWKHHRACLCERTAMEEEELRHKAQMHKDLVERNRRICFEQRNTESICFDSCSDETKNISYARKYVNAWDEVKRKNEGLLFWGDVGTGKSYTAACIANALLEQEKTVYMANFSMINNGIFAKYDKNEYLNWLCHFDLLIIDDLGTERHTEYSMENIFTVIDARMQSRKPMIFTTNLDIDYLNNPQSMDERRIYDRVLENCVPIEFKGESRRTKTAEEKLNDLTIILKRNEEVTKQND